MNREQIIAMTTEEAWEWIHEVESDTPEFIRRHNAVHWDCGLSRMGISLKEPTGSGELKCEI